MSTEIIVIDKQEIEQMQGAGASLIESAREVALSIKDNKSLAIAADMMLEAKERIKAVEGRLKKPKADARQSWQNICDLENELCEPYRRIEKEILKPAMARFDKEQEQKRQAEQERLRSEATKKEEEARLVQAQKAESVGDKKMADAILEAPVFVPPVVLPKEQAPTGIQYRDVWRFEIDNYDLVPRDYCTVDEKKIGGVVRALKGETKIPGVRVYSERIVAGRV